MPVINSKDLHFKKNRKILPVKNKKTILFWGNRIIGQLLRKQGKEIYIAKNFIEFSKLVPFFLFPFFYIESTRTHLNRIIQILRKYPNKKFYIIGRLDFEYPNPRALDLSNENNIIQQIFDPEHFLIQFKKFRNLE